MKPNVYLYILVMAGVTYHDSYASTGPFQKGNHQSVCKILSVLCAICMSCCYDISGNPDATAAGSFPVRRDSL